MVFVNGGPAANNNCTLSSGGGGGETTLDTEYSIAMSNSFGCYCDTAKVYIYEAPATAVTSNNQPGMATGTFFDLWNTSINNNQTRILSMSWGGPEDDCLRATWTPGTIF